MPFDVADELLQTVQFELVDELHLLAEVAFWEAFVVVPDDVVFGQINQESALVFPERHFGMREFDELLLVFIHWMKSKEKREKRKEKSRKSKERKKERNAIEAPFRLLTFYF